MLLLLTGVATGVFGTLAMDFLNHLFSRTGIILKIDIAMIGRMSAGWGKGRFRYSQPGEMEPVDKEFFYGVITHYAIGVALSLPYVLGWHLLVGGPTSPLWALVYGVMTTVASWFLVYPSMGMGVFGRHSPEGLKAVFSPLANHLFFGAGMAVAVASLN